MFRGPFQIEASGVAEKLDVASLPDLERTHLTHGIKFDPETHDIYRFFVAPRIEILDEPPKRKEKRKSFEKVTRVLVDIKRSRKGIYLWGMFPTTLKADGSWELDLTANAILNPVMPGVGSLKLAAEGRKVVRQKGRPWIKAHRTDSNAQWIFFKEWLDDSSDFRLQITCVVDSGIPDDQRCVLCNAKFADEGRAIETLLNHRVLLPV